MIIVSDTTPIISLLKIGRLDLLQKLFGEILIPKAVYDELTVNKQYVEEAKKVQESSYIKAVAVSNTEAVRILKMDGYRAGSRGK